MAQQKINCEQARQIDLVSYLETLNIYPAKIRGNDYWYHSPFHQERTPSFKINRKLNVWYDHSIGQGGNLIDFGIAFHHCSVAAFLEKLNTGQNLSALLSFQQHSNPNVANVKNKKNVKDKEMKNSVVNAKNVDGILKTDVENSSNTVAKMKNQNDAIMRNSVAIMKNLDGNLIDYNDSSIMKEENKRFKTYLNESERVETKINDFEREQTKMKILFITDIESETLQQYIASRGISLPLAQRYCKEVLIAFNQKQRCMIGFKNQSGGYELRATDDFKSTIAPKDFTFVPNEKQAGLNAIAVVEGFFDFLSLLEKQDTILSEMTNFLVLNSLSFLRKPFRSWKNIRKFTCCWIMTKPGKVSRHPL